MNFVDKILVQLADPQQRVNLFDHDALELLVGAAYQTSEMSITGPYEPFFDEPPGR